MLTGKMVADPCGTVKFGYFTELVKSVSPCLEVMVPVGLETSGIRVYR